jgi:hypothetical protein
MKKLVVSIATVGLTMCNSGGAVDPAPQPLVCSNVGDGHTLSANASIAGKMMTITISTSFDGQWKAAPTLSNVVGASVTSIKASGSEATIVLDFGSEAGAGDGGADGGTGLMVGSFTLTGTLTDGSKDCPVTRTFHFNGMQITQLEDSLPLRNHTPATIEVTGKTEREVRLRALGARLNDTVVWTATDGVLAQRDSEVLWTLPEEPGLYQVEVLVDRGGEGVALDTLVMEVV